MTPVYSQFRFRMVVVSLILACVRFSTFHAGLTQIFGGFVAYGVSYSHDKHLKSYKIIYLLLGGLAIVVGVIVILFLPDSPVNARMLSKEERIAALERVRDDQGGVENKKWKKDQIVEALTDIRTWLIVLTTMLSELSDLLMKRVFSEDPSSEYPQRRFEQL